MDEREQLTRLVNALEPVMDWLVDDVTGGMWGDIEAMIRSQYGAAGLRKHTRQIMALYAAYRATQLEREGVADG